MIADREGGKLVNIALIQKDRTDKVNGQEIPYPNFEKLSAHFNALNLGGEHHGSMHTRDSKDLYTETGDDTWSAEQRQRAIQSEEISGLMQKYFPSQSADDKKQRLDLMEQFFGTRSWTKVENTPSDKLKEGLAALREFLQSPPKQPEKAAA
jgi:hypothetical protein